MHYHLCDHIYMTQFKDELILLDTKRDRYTVYFKELSELLMDILGKNASSSKKKTIFAPGLSHSSQELATLQQLINDSIIEEKDSPYPFYVDQKPYSDGVSNVDWCLPLENKKVRLNLQVLDALRTLIKVYLYIKFQGFYATIQLIKKSQKSQTNYIIPEGEELKDLANVVNKACLIYPTRTKCLEWATTFVLMALKRNWRCNLEIGVQNYPFFAHAWVECDGKVVMDDQDLREGLAIILNEPFRKVTI